MTKALSKYRPGLSVNFVCYHFGCAEVAPMQAVLKEEFTHMLYPGFRGSERFGWKKGTPVRAFVLEESVRCPHCKQNLAEAIIVSRGPLKTPTIFGYEAEAA